MKRLFTICVLILIPVCVFASYDISIRAGGAFDFFAGHTSKDLQYSDKISDEDFSSMGFGFDIGLDLDLTKDLLMYIDFAMVLPPSVLIGDNVTRSDIDALFEMEQDKDPDYAFHSGRKLFNAISAHIGFGHKLNLNLGAFVMSVGAGFGFSRFNEGFKMVKMKDNLPYYSGDFDSVTILSVGLYGNMRYSFSGRLSTVLTVLPDMGFFTIARRMDYSQKNEADYKEVKPAAESSGFAISFAVKTAIGISYTF